MRWNQIGKNCAILRISGITKSRVQPAQVTTTGLALVPTFCQIQAEGEAEAAGGGSNLQFWEFVPLAIQQKAFCSVQVLFIFALISSESFILYFATKSKEKDGKDKTSNEIINVITICFNRDDDLTDKRYKVWVS